MVIEIIKLRGEYNIIGLIDSFKNSGEKIMDYEILGSEEIIPDLILANKIHGGIIAIGDNFTRRMMKDKILSHNKDFNFISAVHPFSCLYHNVSIPKGTVIMAGVIINNDAEIGEFCILNTKSSLGHDSIMKPFSSLAPGVTTGGNVSIGIESAICIGATITQNIIIGDYCVIGASSLVIRNLDDYSLAYGIPAKLIKQRKPDDKYLGKMDLT